MPGFKIEMIIKRVPRIFIEEEGRQMGKSIALGVTEKSIIRVIRFFANNGK